MYFRLFINFSHFQQLVMKNLKICDDHRLLEFYKHRNIILCRTLNSALNEYYWFTSRMYFRLVINFSHFQQLVMKNLKICDDHRLLEFYKQRNIILCRTLK